MFYKIKNVEILTDMELKIEFEIGKVKYYDLKKLVEKYKKFEKLLDTSILKSVKVDIGGYGISWSEELDIGCNELWENGYEK